MKKRFFPWVLLILVSFSLLLLASCAASTSSSDFYNVGAANLSVTGAEFDQYLLFRFDTTSQGCIMTLPSAADIITNISGPYVGEVLSFAVSAEGRYNVTLIPGTNVTIKPSASTVPGNTTVTMYCEFDNITSGSYAVTIY